MSQVDEVITLQIKPREIEVVSLQIPVEAMRSLEEVARWLMEVRAIALSI